MKKIAVFPGSFDPFTIGHETIVKRALTLFDQIVVAIGYNSDKPGYFSFEQRLKWIEDVFKNDPRVIVEAYQGLTVDLCKKHDTLFIIRGLRNAADFEYEKSISQVNKYLLDNLETVFLVTDPEYSAITSTLVRDIIRHGGNASKFLPKNIKIS